MTLERRVFGESRSQMVHPIVHALNPKRELYSDAAVVFAANFENSCEKLLLGRSCRTVILTDSVFCTIRAVVSVI